MERPPPEIVRRKNVSANREGIAKTYLMYVFGLGLGLDLVACAPRLKRRWRFIEP